MLKLLLRICWFIFVGSWIGQIWLVIAWILNLTIIGFPLGMWMLSRLPQVMTLRSEPFNLGVVRKKWRNLCFTGKQHTFPSACNLLPPGRLVV